MEKAAAMLTTLPKFAVIQDIMTAEVLTIV
jgi:hypothetical protein